MTKNIYVIEFIWIKMLLLSFSDLSLNPSPQARDFTDCKQEHHLIDATAVSPFSCGERVRDRGREKKI